MNRRHAIVGAALATVFPMSAIAGPSSGEPTNESSIQINLTPKEFEQACKLGVLGAEKCKIIEKRKEAAKKLTYHLPTISSYVLPPNCSPVDKALFVRSDPLDNFHYVSDVAGTNANAAAKGLSINYTDNIQANTQTATINGRVSYLLVGGQCSSPYLDPYIPFMRAIGFAPFISSSGTWNEPLTTTVTGTTSAGKTITITTTKTSSSALRGGADFQLELATGGFPLMRDHYFYVSPFYQTDYRGLAQINGATLAWEPVSTALHLDYGPYNPYFMFFWQFRGEAEFTQVSNPGLTQFVKGEHSLIGEEARPHLELFPLVPGTDWDDWFNAFVAGRISLIGAQQFYWDAATAKTAPYYSAMVQYKLGECKVDLKNPGSACSIKGSSSISFEYDWGRDKDTFVKTNQMLVKLSYSY